MLRLLELSLFLVPVLLYAVWRTSAAEGGPPPRVIIMLAAGIFLMAGFLFWFSQEGDVDPTATYVPPMMQDGRLVPGHAVPR